MASMTKTASRQKNSARGVQLDFQFVEDNSPNPDIFLPSLRHSGYTLETAVGDLVDNPLDHEASVVLVSVDKIGREWSITVADDGTGMDLETLDQMMRLGSRAEHDLESDLGKFGLGSTTASLALGRTQHVVTSYDPQSWASAATSLDEIIRQESFVKHLDDARPEEIDLLQQAFARCGLEPPPTGTIVRVLDTTCLLDARQRDSYYPCMDLRIAALAIRSSLALAFLPNSRSAISASVLSVMSFGSRCFFLGA